MASKSPTKTSSIFERRSSGSALGGEASASGADAAGAAGVPAGGLAAGDEAVCGADPLHALNAMTNANTAVVGSRVIFDRRRLHWPCRLPVTNSARTPAHRSGMLDALRHFVAVPRKGHGCRTPSR